MSTGNESHDDSVNNIPLTNNTVAYFFTCALYIVETFVQLDFCNYIHFIPSIYVSKIILSILIHVNFTVGVETRINDDLVYVILGYNFRFKKNAWDL